ncbi:pyridoxamine 5'-phosphate oxidase family protein [Aquimarina mytili]|uniref:Pyridoxamine 5'-phosphate oxidase family protein n=1 Tax=Aquimarina mytili TaxID=874423 RepID=A0A936ZT75_9FLAO|nr:pyridoxamine 5'-phosphate oxidase family protein [Aquimarina mytili]MBL0684977.1 pyridoxamine 5'-phosphate oxidase family protein [Aquimarina mytili]
MTNIIFSSICNDLKNASKTAGHPFRYFTLATSDINGAPRLRTVVLRDIDDQLNLIVYTDQRSKKITHINEQNKVSLLFMDSKRLIQLSIRARAEIIKDNSTLKKIWDQIPQKSKRDYTTELAPGKEIKDPDEIDFLEDKHFFSAIKIIPRRIEFLRLQRPNHIRVLFKREDDRWNGTYLVP